MIPSGYKEDVVYSQIPTSGAGDLSFTRASNGTRVNSAGLVEVVAWNLLQYSEDFSNGYWAKYNLTITSNSTTAPNGTTTADTMLSSTATIAQVIEGAATLISGQTNTITIYAKYKDTAFLQILVPSFVSSQYVNFNIQTGVISGGSYTTASIESVGNGWFRCQFAYTSAYSGSTTAIAISLVDSGTALRGASFTGDGVKGIYIWGAQLNIGSTAKPYFPTTDRLNVPRLTYQNGGGGCPSLLLEKQSTNLATYSEQFDNAAWVKTNATITANQIASPDGNTNADLLQSASSTEPRIRQTTTQTGSAAFTFSCFAKKGNVNFLILRNIAVNAVGGSRAWFNLDTGVVGTVNAGLTASMQSYGNGWYRCIITGTTELLPTNLVDISLSSTDNSISGSAVGSNIFIWGAQLEASSYPTSYIPTTSASATRVADACFKTGISSLIGQTEGTLFAELTANITGSTQQLELGNGTSANRVNLRLTSTNSFQLVIVQAASVVFNQTAVATFAQGQNLKIAAVYKSGAVTQMFVNGVSVLTGTAGTITGSLSAIFSGSIGGTLDLMNSPVKQIVVFPTALTNTQAIELTT
jgi:hypothetical protein